MWSVRSSLGRGRGVTRGGREGADGGSSLAGHVRHHRHRQSATDAGDARRRGTDRRTRPCRRRDLRCTSRRRRSRWACPCRRRVAARPARRARPGRARRPGGGPRRPPRPPRCRGVGHRAAARRQPRPARRRCARTCQCRADRSQGRAVGDPPRPVAHRTGSRSARGTRRTTVCTRWVPRRAAGPVGDRPPRGARPRLGRSARVRVGPRHRRRRARRARRRTRDRSAVPVRRRRAGRRVPLVRVQGRRRDRRTR